MAGEALTPMMQQYFRIKTEVPQGAFVMFRLGDFYELFGEDAVKAAPILGATLTHRGDMPMCGVPHHAIDAYLAKLIRAGKTAAICEQMEDPRMAKGLVRREVTRIVTPGTVTEDGLLDSAANTYAAAVSGLAVAMMDLSTGEFFAEEFPSPDKLVEAFERYLPAETILPRRDEDSPADPGSTEELVRSACAGGATEVDAWTFATDAAREALLRHFAVTALDGFGIEGHASVISAAGALLHYVHVTLRHPVEHVRTIRLRDSSDFLTLDSGTLRHLLLVPSHDVAKNVSLLGVLDVAKTPMGQRTMRNWTVRPLGRAAEINARLDRVETFTRERGALSGLRVRLDLVKDLERLIAKVDSGRANARDVKVLGASLRPVPDVKASVPANGKFDDLVSRLVPETELVDLIDRAIADQPAATTNDGDMFRPGYNSELDSLREIAAKGHQWLAEYQAKEIERTGIKTLKVRHNSVFGFYIEISKGLAAQAPAEYERRQTLTNAERFVTPELKEYERDVMGAHEKAVALESELFRELVEKISAKTAEIQSTAAALGELDATLALADRALALGYVRPVVDDSDVLEIEDGRHPIVEQLPDAEPFVPNSTKLNCTTDQIMLITGPNAAGKSTYIRQVATIAVMAHMGSFVPASAARFGVLDRVFTRIGAGDDLARGRSTFLVEMQEAANILNNATGRSLIVLDEIGRGTSTFDGISIAWSVAEYLHNNPKVKAKTLFATHYHELTDLADVLPGVKNYTVRVKEEGRRVIFLRRIAPGVAEKSFGIHVAAMAGLPHEVVDRATAILKNLEANELDVNAPKMVRRPRKKLSDVPGQMTFGF